MFAEGDNMFRIGQSIDIHQLVEGRDLYIGGVKIDHDKIGRASCRERV